jgi:Na+/H+ antiporter NhaA
VLDVRSLDLNFYLVVAFVLLVVKIFAFVNSLVHSNEEYEAAGKLTKTAWTLILGLGVVVQLLLGGPLGLLNIVFTIAAFVYLADVRPAIAGLRRR